MGFARVYLSGDLLAAVFSEGSVLTTIEGLPPGSTFEGITGKYLLFWHDSYPDDCNPPVIQQVSFGTGAVLALTAGDIERVGGGEFVRRSVEQVVLGSIPPGEDRSDAETQHVLNAVSRYVRQRPRCGPGGCSR